MAGTIGAVWQKFSGDSFHPPLTTSRILLRPNFQPSINNASTRAPRWRMPLHAALKYAVRASIRGNAGQAHSRGVKAGACPVLPTGSRSCRMMPTVPNLALPREGRGHWMMGRATGHGSRHERSEQYPETGHDRLLPESTTFRAASQQSSRNSEAANHLDPGARLVVHAIACHCRRCARPCVCSCCLALEVPGSEPIVVVGSDRRLIDTSFPSSPVVCLAMLDAVEAWLPCALGKGVCLCSIDRYRDLSHP